MTNAMDPASFTPEDSPLTMQEVMAAPEYRDLMTPKVTEGDRAPDFTLESLDRSGDTVTLSAFTGKRPVALIFGSYT